MRKWLNQDAQTRGEAFFHLHLAVFLYGFTAILGSLISLPGIATVWFRMAITVLAFSLVPGLPGQILKLEKRQIVQLFIVGFLLAIHWTLFFAAIKASNVSVTLCCIATGSLFTALFEPALTRKPFRLTELILGLLVIPGIYLIYAFNSFSLTGILLGLGASVIGSFFSVLNKRWVTGLDPVLVTWAELASGWLLLNPFIWYYYKAFPNEGFMPEGLDWIWLLLLALLCTNVAYVSNLKALRWLSTFTVNLTINLEPVYGIILAVLLLDEHKEMGLGFYLGALLVIGSVFLHPLLEKLFPPAPQD